VTGYSSSEDEDSSHCSLLFLDNSVVPHATPEKVLRKGAGREL